MSKTKLLCALVLPLSVAFSGCNKQEKKVAFEPNRVFAKATEINVGYSMDQALSEAQTAISETFGTPDDPKIPDFLEGDLKDIVSLENLKLASGPLEQGRGLYRKNCITCHGITGDGRGINAMQADVYPRDFRMGKFKFKTTARGSKPIKDDLFATIRNGIAATPMQRIQELTDDDVRALVDYVIYLSWRGETERNLLTAGADIEFENGGHLYDSKSEGFAEQQQMLKDTVTEVAESWASAADAVKQPSDPGDIPVHATLDELIAAANSDTDSPLKASLTRGKELFTSDTASCSKCHGPLGHGDGQTQDYDDWTKDWTLAKGIDPTDNHALIPLLARGGLPPKKIVPRDFRQGVYRGGADPEKLYVRVSQGIEGTPMPGAESTLKPEDIWNLVNYVRSLAIPAKDTL